jgi:metallo-beta-lactamase family protein
MTIELQFLGAARHVTGTKHLLIVNDKQVLLDCGMVQGPREMANQANRKLPLDAQKVDAVVLSHAHIDHSGSLPRLVKEGFRGRIWCTHATKDLVAILLKDAAHIAQQDARHLDKHGHRFVPPYDIGDVEKTIGLLRGVRYRERFQVVPEVSVELYDAGHILGAAMVVLEVDDGKIVRRIAFTGDHGRKNLPILKDPERLPDCDVLITESTYGNKVHAEQGEMEDALARIVIEEQQDQGRIIVPAFSVGRTQNLVMFLGNLIAAGKIPKIPIYVDSPLSREATKVMSRHPDCFDEQTQGILRAGRSPFFFDGVRYVSDVEESKSLNDVRTGLIIAASGMCESGRVLHHLKLSVGRKEDCVLLVAFQAQGTLGRRLQEGVSDVRIFGEWYKVRCRVREMGGFSAHADYQELLAHTGPLAAKCRQAFVVHGEEPTALIYADRLRKAGFRSVEVPRQRDRFEIT